MFRAALEILLPILLILVARAVFTSVMRGAANAARNSQSNAAPDPPSQNKARTGQQRAGGGDLHKDPVCGTYVAESTAFRRQTGGQTFYYCSEACREKHALVAR